MNLIFSTILLSLVSFNLNADSTESLNSINDNSEFNMIVWATNEVAAKECKAEGELPRSFYLWRDMAFKYSKREEKNDQIFYKSIDDLKNTISVMKNRTNGMDNQVDAILLQLISLDAARMNLAEKVAIKVSLLSDIDFAVINAVNENKKWIESYENFINLGLKKSLEVANKPCDEKPAVKNCDEAVKILSSISSVFQPQLKNEYDKKLIDSKEDLEKLKKIELQVSNAIYSLPDGNDGHNWRESITKEYNKLLDVQKTIAISCLNSSQSSSVTEISKLISSLEENKISDTDKNNQIVKSNLTQILFNVDSTKIIDELKKLPITWDKMNKKMAVGLDRIDLLNDIQNRFKEIFKSNTEELSLLQERRETLLKMLLSIKDVVKYKIDEGLVCPKLKNIPAMWQCPDDKNPLCDVNSKENFEWEKYVRCSQGISKLNNEMDAIASASNSIKNDPNLVAIVEERFGRVGPFYKAKIKNADGTFTYKSLSEGAPQPDPCSAVVAGPTFGPCPTNGHIEPSPTLTKSSQTIVPTTQSSKTEQVDYDAPLKILLKSTKEYQTYYEEKISKTDTSTYVSVLSICGTRPFNGIFSAKCSTNNSNSWCDPNSKERQQLEKYNKCVGFVNTHNEIIDAKGKLSDYIKNNVEFQGIVKSPITGFLVAKMKKENGDIYYLALNYNPNKNE